MWPAQQWLSLLASVLVGFSVLGFPHQASMSAFRPMTDPVWTALTRFGHNRPYGQPVEPLFLHPTLSADTSAEQVGLHSSCVSSVHLTSAFYFVHDIL